ncbi:hypothetical protein J6590_084546 [Homalodisca vitripennis]|nr:hypothetical protein J6590_084546 [Homalodisca vitripennis]
MQSDAEIRKLYTQLARLKEESVRLKERIAIFKGVNTDRILIESPERIAISKAVLQHLVTTSMGARSLHLMCKYRVQRSGSSRDRADLI